MKAKYPSHISKIILFTICAFAVFISSIDFAISQNYVTTYTGTGSAGFVNGDTSIASFDHPFGICIDPDGNLYLADAYNNIIRKIGTDGMVSTFAGTGVAGFLDGPADEAQFNQPFNLSFDADGNLVVSDFLNQRIRMISTDGIVSTIAGTGNTGYLDGPASEAMFNYPRGICLDDTGNIYVGDSWNHRIRRISIDGTVTTWAGGGTAMGVQSIGDYVDASDTAARFYTPCEVTIDQFNNIFVADAYNHRIRMIDPTRMVTTVSGSGGFGPAGGGFANGQGDQAQFNTPTACFVALDGHLFVGDGSNQRIRMIDTDHYVTTLAGSGIAGFQNGTDTLAQFNFPRGTVMDYNLNRLYVVDYYNHAVRIVHFVPITTIDENFEFPVNIYPVPFSDKLHISFQEEIGSFDISIKNLKGVEVYSMSDFYGSNASIELKALNAGVYFLVIEKEGKLVFSKKILKRSN